MEPRTRLEAHRRVRAPAADLFALLCDPWGHVAIDSSGMLQSASGEPVRAAGDSFAVHMDREALGDRPELGEYDVTVVVRDHEPDRHLSWTVLGRIRPQLGHVFGYLLEPDPDDAGATLVTSYYDWSDIAPAWRDAGIFPVIPQEALRATLGILDRTARLGYARG
jgi:hypothetical protein